MTKKAFSESLDDSITLPELETQQKISDAKLAVEKAKKTIQAHQEAIAAEAQLKQDRVADVNQAIEKRDIAIAALSAELTLPG